MLSTVLPLLALTLFPPFPPSATLGGCDPDEVDVCASADVWWDGLNFWIGINGSTQYPITGLSVTIPGVFASQVSQMMEESWGEWWFDLYGDYATVGEFDPITETDFDAQFGVQGPSVFHFLLSAPLTAGEIRMDFAALRHWDPDLDPMDYTDDYVAGFVSASVQIAPTTVTPEPAGLALLGTGLAGVAAVRRRRSRREAA